MDKRSIVVTGISGYAGRVLLPHLTQDASVDRVIGVDRRSLGDVSADKVTYHQVDVREAAWGEILEGADTVVHLAFVLMRRPQDDEQEIDEINVEGSCALFDAAAQHGVRKVVFTSSVVAYGLHPDNPVPLTEASPLRPNPGLYYSRDKAAVEKYLDTYESQHPEMIVTRLRPCTIVGPCADPRQMASFVSDSTIVVRSADPLYQLLHEDDFARALHMAIQQDMPGIYNVTSDDPRTIRQLGRLRGSKIVTLPYPLVRGLMGLTWRLGKADFAPGWADLVRYPIVASNEKLKQLGWQPEFATPEALEVLVDAF